MHARYVPILLLKEGGLYKTRKFDKETYLGDPVNTIKIFNDKLVDELVFLDIAAARRKSEPNIEMLKDIAGECFMPLAYGGGITSVDQVREILAIGFEKIVVNSAAWTDPDLVPILARVFGSSTVVGSIDVKRNWMGREKVHIHGGGEAIPMDVVEWARELERRGWVDQQNLWRRTRNLRGYFDFEFWVDSVIGMLRPGGCIVLLPAMPRQEEEIFDDAYDLRTFHYCPDVEEYRRSFFVRILVSKGFQTHDCIDGLTQNKAFPLAFVYRGDR